MGRQSGTPLYAMMHRAVDDLSLTPREYYERNVWVGASISARSDIANRHELGVDRVLWGSDYPHHEGSFPHTRVAMRWLFEGVPEPEVRAMTSLNAAKVYGFDLDFLQGLADEIGPTPEEIAAPLSAAEVPDTSMCTAVVEAIYGLAGAGAAGA
jgi:hypothetical protein